MIRYAAVLRCLVVPLQPGAVVGVGCAALKSDPSVSDLVEIVQGSISVNIKVSGMR